MGKTDDWLGNRNIIDHHSLHPLKVTVLALVPQEFYQDGNGPGNVGIYNLSKGVNRFCLSKPGTSERIDVL
jgi:hypothetical protein